MSNYPHTVTVGETFAGIKVEITISAADLVVGHGRLSFPGHEFAQKHSPIGQRVRNSMATELARLHNLTLDVAAAANQEMQQARTQEKADAVQAAKDETAKHYHADIDALASKSSEALARAEADHAATIDRITRERDEAVAALFAKHKRSTAAKAGHMRKASKAGRK